MLPGYLFKTTDTQHTCTHLFPVLDEDESGHGADVVFAGNVLCLVDVHLQEHDVVHLAIHLKRNKEVRVLSSFSYMQQV